MSGTDVSKKCWDLSSRFFMPAREECPLLRPADAQAVPGAAPPSTRGDPDWRLELNSQHDDASAASDVGMRSKEVVNAAPGRRSGAVTAK